MRIAVWVLLAIETYFAVGGLVGAFRKGTGGDAAGRGLAQGYAVILFVLWLLLAVPALVLQLHDHSGWALGLAIAFVLPVLGLIVAG